jgi:hypothetical protein
LASYARAPFGDDALVKIRGIERETKQNKTLLAITPSLRCATRRTVYKEGRRKENI